MSESSSSGSFLGDVVAGIGRRPSEQDIEAAFISVRKRKRNGLHDWRKVECRADEQHDPSKQEEENEKALQSIIIDDQEVVEIARDTDNIDVITDYQDFEGKISPYSKKTEDLLPRHIFRVVHAGSAGAVIEKQNITYFLSQAAKLDSNSDHEISVKSTTRFDIFDMEDITDQLRSHISGWKSSKGRPFASSWISTSDSFEETLNRALRSKNKGFEDVVIYIIDTATLQQPSLVILMYLAIKAYNISEHIPAFLDGIYRLGTLTEWLFFDSIAVTKVVKMNFEPFTNPSVSKGLRLSSVLQDFVPEVVEAAKYSKKQRRGVPRSRLQARLIHTQQELKDIQYFDENIFAKRTGPVQPVSKAAKDDRRCNIEDVRVDALWDMVPNSDCKGIVVLWILSLMTKQHYSVSIADAVCKLYPQIVEDSLHEITTQGEGGKKTMVYYMSGPDCLGRVDVNNYQRLMLLCIETWLQRQSDNIKSGDPGIEVYVVSGNARPARNLIRLEQVGLLGRCTTENVLPEGQLKVKDLDLDEVLKHGTKLVVEETDEQFWRRHSEQYGPIFYYPHDATMTMTSRVSSVGLTEQPTLQSELKDDAAKLRGKTAEDRLLQAKKGSPPNVGQGSSS